MGRQSILKKTVEVGGLTGLSRILGITREILLVRFLGVGALSDAFIVAFKIPNFLRKIFAEGALSAAFIPSFVQLLKDKDKRDDAFSLMSVAFLFFEGIVAGLCVLVFFYAENIVLLMAPGFSSEQLAHAGPYLRILFPLILFLSSSALLSGALQAVNHFFVTAFAPVLLNIFFISTLLLCLYLKLSVSVLCYGVLLGGMCGFVTHLIMYRIKGLHFGAVTARAWQNFQQTLVKFSHCLFGVSIFELNVFVDTQIASFLPKGSVTLLHYGARFMAIPLGIFAIAFSTIMLPHFSAVALYSRKRLHYYLVEVAKFICWVSIPATFFLIYFSRPLFANLLLLGRGTPMQIWQAQWILICFSCGLLFLSLNKVLTNIYYAIHDTWTPTMLGIISTLVNLLGNILSLLLAGQYASFGIALSTVIAAAVLTLLLFVGLVRYHSFVWYNGSFLQFLIRAMLQSVLILIPFMLVHKVSLWVIRTWAHDIVVMWGDASMLLIDFFEKTIGYWLLAAPLAGLAIFGLYCTRTRFGIDLYFLRK